MKSSEISRRRMIQQSAAMAAMAWLGSKLPAEAASLVEEGEIIPFLEVQPKGKMLYWAGLKDWVTPNEDVFTVGHYGTPEVDPSKWQLSIEGLVRKPRSLTLEEIKSRRRKTVTAVLECSGNGSNPGFSGAVGNVRWTGTPLAPLLKECGPLKRAIEAVFFGADEKVEKIREKDYLQNFARSLAVGDAMRDDILLAYEMNGEPLSKGHGAPLRLVVPGWFGIAWIKWLTRIELLDRRYMSKYMGREYVTIRGEEKEGRTIWRETSVGPIATKSMIARAVRLRSGVVRFVGAAWTDGSPLKSVEISIDGGAWEPARILPAGEGRYGWRFWSHDWTHPVSGEHKVVARAVDAEGRVQPSAEDGAIKLKRTYWEASQQVPRTFKI